MQNIQVNTLFLNRFIFSDECVFQAPGKVKTHNVKILRAETAHERIEVSVDSIKVTVRRRMSVNQIYGTYNFDSHVVTGKRYNQSRTRHILPLLSSSPPDTIFQQNGAPLHYGLAARELLEDSLLKS